MIDRAQAASHLKTWDFQALFIEELGWDHPRSRQDEVVEANGVTFGLSPIAEKRGVRIFHCATIPDRNIRQRIEREITKRAFEHLIIFADDARTKQIWQWVAREKGKPAAFREHSWLITSAPDALIQKLDHIAFTLNEEEGLTLAGTTLRMRDAFDREKITKKFYESFKEQHEQFLGFITGITNKADQQWYASLMLNRLMFVYFIQKKRFLDGDIDYLKNRLAQVKATKGDDQFHSFYRAFLLKLFHGGLAVPKNQRDAETIKLLGTIPYLNGGLFEPHLLEAEGNSIQISDAAFEGVFDFFDQYEWTLDTRAIERADGREINPDVLGHIFEKYINQKQMGAYYTKEDITDYITKNTVVPWLFRNAAGLDKVAFEAKGYVWRLLSDNPDTYIYSSVKHGTSLALPDNIAAGISNVSARGDWNKTATSDLGLPTEIWREVVARRGRYESIKARIDSGEISSIEELITLNLDIRQFARDVIQYAESPDVVRAFWKGISAIKVLDPACGSGAFLFAALGILYDLYDACLERMEQFVAASPEVASGRAQRFSDFRQVLDQVAAHPNRDYFIYKSIIIANLYGVDIMDEAVEICKLRLFLKLAAQLERPDQIEPLPDIDFNIRAGNSLIGYTSMEDVRKATNAALDLENRVSKIEAASQDLDEAFKQFRKQQTVLGGAVTPEDKSELRRRLNVLESQLGGYLAHDYGVKVNDQSAFKAWKTSHKPFHWLIEFYGIISGGGFDVVVGNPPYLEAREVDYLPVGLKTLETRAVHGIFVERSDSLLSIGGGISMILPMSLVSTQRMQIVQSIIENGRTTWYSNFAWRPAKLFDNVNRALTIFVSFPTEKPNTFSTGYTKWTSASREQIIFSIGYVTAMRERGFFWVPKFKHALEPTLLEKILAQPITVERICGAGGGRVFYRTTGGLYWKVFTSTAPKFFVNNVEGSSSRETTLSLRPGVDVDAIVALLSSSTFWWWYTITSNLRDLNPMDIHAFRLNESITTDRVISRLGREYLEDLESNSVMLTRQQKQTGTTQTQSFKIQRSKSIIDKIDQSLAAHFDFSENELDFIINYDIKYRIGPDAGDAD